MHWKGYGAPPDAAPAPHSQGMGDQHTTLLLDINRAVADIRHMQGHHQARLEAGDQMHRQMHARMDRQDVILFRMHGEMRAIKMGLEKSPMTKEPNALKRLEHVRMAIEHFSTILKEVWPFLALFGAILAKRLGFDPSGLFGP